MLLNSCEKDKLEVADTFHPAIYELAADMVLFNERDLAEQYVIYLTSEDEASTSTHIPTLAKLFPMLRFYLYSTKSVNVSSCKNITLCQRVFDDVEASKWSHLHEKVILISKVKDLNLQKNWLRIIKPVLWSISFNLSSIPAGTKTFEYYQGLLSITPFGKADCEDVHLHGTQHFFLKTYVVKDIISALFHHNTVVRPNKKMFANIFSGVIGVPYCDAELFDNSFDSTYFLFLFMNYVRRPNAIARPQTEGRTIAFVKRVLNFMMRS